MSGIGGIGSTSQLLLQQLQQSLFSKIDGDSDGNISKTELESAVTKAGGTTASADALFTSLDSDGSSAVSQDEFSNNFSSALFSDGVGAHLIAHQAKKGTGESADTSGASAVAGVPHFGHHLFSKIDSDGDGSITKTELETAVTANGGTTEAADALYSALDPDGTGSVSASQFGANLKSVFESLGPDSSTRSTSGDTAADALKALLPPPPPSDASASASTDDSSTSTSSSSTAADALLKLLEEYMASQNASTSSSDQSTSSLAASAAQSLVSHYAQIAASLTMTPSTTSVTA